MELLAILFLISSIASVAKGFDLIAHRYHSCTVGSAKFICFGVGYLYCCQRSLANDHSRLQTFLSMSQTQTTDADILIIHNNRGTDGCGRYSVGSSTYGCANEEGLGLPRGGLVRSCVHRNCAVKRSEMATESEGGKCKGVHEADAVFYKGFYAYDAQPKQSRHIELIHKIDMDEELTESELQELEPLRMPFADIQNSTVVEGSKESKS